MKWIVIGSNSSNVEIKEPTNDYVKWLVDRLKAVGNYDVILKDNIGFGLKPSHHVIRFFYDPVMSPVKKAKLKQKKLVIK